MTRLLPPVATQISPTGTAALDLSGGGD